MKDLTITTVDGAVYKPSRKNNLFMEYWTDPSSETFGNVYKSGQKAGFSKTYSKNLLNVAPKWLTTFIDRTNLTEEHITQGIQRLAQAAPNSKSPDDTRLKAYELLMKLKGLTDNKNHTNITLVQPILAGKSMEDYQRKTVENEQKSTVEDSTDTPTKSNVTPPTDTHVVEAKDLIPE